MSSGRHLIQLAGEGKGHPVQRQQHSGRLAQQPGPTAKGSGWGRQQGQGQTWEMPSRHRLKVARFPGLVKPGF